MPERSNTRTVLTILIPAVAVVLVGVVLLAPGYPIESPCPPLLYTVSYASPLCNATLLEHSGPFPLARLWWPDPWNGTPDLVTGSGLARAMDHLNIPATSGDPVTVQDRDGDLNLSGGDIVEMWSPGGCGGLIRLYIGSSATSLNPGPGLWMKAGYQLTCGGNAPDLVTPIVIGALLVAAVAVPLVLVLRLWRRVPRG